MAEKRTEEYLKAIYKRQTKETPVSVSALAEEFQVSPSAASSMLRKLEERGFINYGAGKEVSLTKEGTKVAASLIRRHRLWERFLTDILGLKWDKVHDEALRLEHATSSLTENKLSSLLGDPDTCPHGHSIPDRNGMVKDRDTIPISEVEPSQKACIIAVSREDARLLRSVAKLGLKPQAVVLVERKNDDGSVELKLNGENISLTREIASSLLAKPVSSEVEITVFEEIPISKLIDGESGVVTSYSGGRGMLGRCLSLGFAPGSTVKMLENFGSGPVLVRIHDTEVALGHGVADKIIVTRKKVGC